MARILGVTIPTEKQVQISLTYVYGIGPAHAKAILETTKVNPTTRVKDLTEKELDAIRAEIDQNYTVEGDLQRIVTGNIKRLKDTQTYRGTRHKLNLPARGQRTRTNGRTKRGKRVAVGGTQKKAGLRRRGMQMKNIIHNILNSKYKMVDNLSSDGNNLEFTTSERSC